MVKNVGVLERWIRLLLGAGGYYWRMVVCWSVRDCWYWGYCLCHWRDSILSCLEAVRCEHMFVAVGRRT